MGARRELAYAAVGANLRAPVATERPLIALAVKDLDQGPKPVHGKLPAAWLSSKLAEANVDGGYPLSATQDGELDAQVGPSGGETYLLQGRVRATVETTCGRCLGPASVPVDADLTLLLVPRADDPKRPARGRKSKESEGEFEFDPDEADVALYDGDTIVLDELIREAIVLELPISPLCSESCAGMALDPSAAAKLASSAIDPRLAKLAELRDKVRKS